MGAARRGPVLLALLAALAAAQLCAVAAFDFAGTVDDVGDFAHMITVDKVYGGGLVPAWKALESFFESGEQRTGKQIETGGWGPCDYLPLVDDALYTEYRPFANMLDNLTLQNIPFLNSGILQATGLSRLLGFCAASNSDAFAFALSPVFPPLRQYLYPATWWVKPYFTGFGLSLKGELEYNSSAMVVYDGFQEVPFVPKGNFWLRGGFDLAPPGTASGDDKETVKPWSEKAFDKLAISVDIEMFGDFDKKDGDTSFFLVVPSVYLWLSILPLVKLGEGYGGYRHSTVDADQICFPNGFFLSLTRELEVPAISGLADKFLKMDTFQVEERRDLGILWNDDGKDGLFTGMFLRYKVVLELMGWSFGNVNIEIQFVTPAEIQRRKDSRKQTSNCLCNTGYDSSGDCKDELTPVNQYILDEFTDETMVFSARYTNEVGFAFNIVQLRDLVLVIAFDFEGSFYITVGGHISVLWVAGFYAYLTVTDQKVDFSFIVYVADMRCTVTGSGDAQGYAIDTPIGGRNLNDDPMRRELSKTFLDTEFDVSLDFDWGDIAGAIGAAVTEGLTATGKALEKGWNEVAGFVSSQVNAIKDFFKEGGKLHAFANDVADFFEKDVANFAKDIVSHLASLPAVKALVDFGKSLAKGDIDEASKRLDKAIKDFLSDIGCTTDEVSTVDAKGSGVNGCPLVKIKYTKTCVGFVPSVEYGDPFEDPKCLDDVAEAAVLVEEKAEEAARLNTVRETSESENVGFAYLNDGGKLKTPDFKSATKQTIRPGDQRTISLNVQMEVEQLPSPSQGRRRLDEQLSKTTVTSSVTIDTSSAAAVEASVRQAQATISGQLITAAQNGNAGQTGALAKETESYSAPVISSVTGETFTCVEYLNVNPELFKPQITFSDTRCVTTVVLHQGQEKDDASTCGGKVVTWTWTPISDCGEHGKIEGVAVEQTIRITLVSPRFKYGVLDDFSVDTSIEDALKPDTQEDLIEAQCSDVALVTYSDAEPLAGPCGSWTIVRTWKVYSQKCPDNFETREQEIDIYDTTPPVWDTFDQVTATVDFLEPYGSDALGHPTAHEVIADSMARLNLVSYPIVIDYEDSVELMSADSCLAGDLAARVTRTWTAQDACGATATSLVQTINVRHPHASQGGSIFGQAAGFSVFAGDASDLESSSIEGDAALGGSSALRDIELRGGGSCPSSQPFALVSELCPDVNHVNGNGYSLAHGPRYCPGMHRFNGPVLAGTTPIDFSATGTALKKLSVDISDLSLVNLRAGPTQGKIAASGTWTTVKPSEPTLGVVDATGALVGNDQLYNIFELDTVELLATPPRYTDILEVQAEGFVFINVRGVVPTERLGELLESGSKLASPIALKSASLTAHPARGPEFLFFNAPDWSTWTPFFGAFAGTLLLPHVDFQGELHQFEHTGGQLLVVNSVRARASRFACELFAADIACATAPGP